MIEDRKDRINRQGDCVTATIRTPRERDAAPDDKNNRQDAKDAKEYLS